MPELETIIGLEVHAQMSTKTKIFCGCSTETFGKAPNTSICPVCTGHPGALPATNGVAVEKAVKASLALGCTVHDDCHFDRKHYFYPDLPMGFQISQYDFPLATNGEVEYDLFDDSGKIVATKKCGITRLHMENDAGKLTHRGNKSLVDYNRAGAPLMEIVTEPDLRSADEAVAFAQELRRILITVDASQADMFKGMMRFDASISLREKGTKELNPRSEIKNLNSFKSLERALAYEEARLRKEWEKDGGPLPGDITVGWLDDDEKTKVLRDKETADDYRYFPEPDIPPLSFSKSYLVEVKDSLPALPRQQKKTYEDLGIDEKQAMQLVDQPEVRIIFDAVYEKTKDAKRAASLVLTQFLGFMRAEEKEFELESVDRRIELISGLIDKIDDGSISANQGKKVMEEMVKTDLTADSIIEQLGMKQISDEGELEAVVDQAIAANPKALEDYKNGKEQALGAIVGFVMKETKGQANPGKVNEIIKSKI